MADWTEDCPARGPLLRHAHWSSCRPPEGHPPELGMVTGRIHQYGQCCHCEEYIGARGGRVVEDLTVPPTVEHLYIPAITGLCARPDCHQPQDRHMASQNFAQAAAQAAEFGLPQDCPVNHGGISTKRLIGDEGWTWTSCPQCGILLEPKEAKGEAVGRPSGLGRGTFSVRDQQRAVARVGWREWLAEHGGGELA